MDDSQIFTLKLHDRKPKDLPLERLAEYIKEFAQIIGKENQPVFSSVDESSILIRARIPTSKAPALIKKLGGVRLGSAHQSLGKKLLRLEEMMMQDGITVADFLNPQDVVLASLQASTLEQVIYSINQDAEIDGEITGVIGADNTMHITLREISGRIVKVVSRVDVGRALGHHIRSGYVRLHTRGQWNRTEDGWKPDPQKCYVDNYESLPNPELLTVFDTIASIPGNGWKAEIDPLALWRELRGTEASQ